MEDNIGPMSRTIREAIQQTRPFHSPAEEALLTLIRTMDRVDEDAVAPIREAGLSAAQYNVLRILRGAGEAGLQTYQVVDRLLTRAPNITRLVDKLEAKGYLTRTRCREDRRVVHVRITASGLELLARLDAPVEASVRAAMRGLPPGDLETLIRLLNRLRQPLEGEAD